MIFDAIIWVPLQTWRNILEERFPHPKHHVRSYRRGPVRDGYKIRQVLQRRRQSRESGPFCRSGGGYHGNANRLYLLGSLQSRFVLYLRRESKCVCSKRGGVWRMVTASTQSMSAFACSGNPDYSAFLQKLNDTILFAKCGGPYPDDPYLRPVEWQEAESIILDMHLDASAHHELDVLLVDAIRTAKRLAVKGISRKILAQLTGGPHKRERALLDTVLRQRLAVAGLWLTEKSKDPHVVQEHVFRLLEAMGELILCNGAHRFPDLSQMVDFALWGYLPVDIERRASGPVCVVY